MLKKLMNQSVLRLWLLFYIVLILLPAISNFYMLNKVNRELKKESIYTRNFLLKNCGITLDSVFNSVTVMTSMLEKNPEVIHMAGAQQLDSGVRYEAYTLSDELEQILYIYQYNAYRYIYDIYIYYPNIDFVVSSEAFLESDSFYLNKISKGGVEYDDWKKLLKPNNTQRVMEGKVSSGSGDVDVVDFIFPVNEKNGTGQYVINVSVKKDSMFRDIADSSVNRGGTLSIVKNNRESITTYGNLGGAFDFNNLKLKKEFESEFIDVNGERMNVIYANSSIGRYKYIYVFPTAENYRLAQKTMISMSVGVGLSLLIMLAVLFFFNNWNYKNLQYILNSFDGEGLAITGEVNEYSAIRHNINTVKSTAQSLKRKLDNMTTLAKNAFLVDYIKGYIPIYEAEKK